jgi:hypothetical protein
MLATTRDPAAPAKLELGGELLFVCPWLAGPDALNRPFSLGTRYGDLVFVFRERSALHERFVEISSEDLPEGHAIESAALLANDESEIHAEVARRLAIGRRVVVAIEGSAEFARYMGELAAGTIWE